MFVKREPQPRFFRAWLLHGMLLMLELHAPLLKVVVQHSTRTFFHIARSYVLLKTNPIWVHLKPPLFALHVMAGYEIRLADG